MTFRTDQQLKDELLRHWEHLMRLVFPPEADIRSYRQEGGYRISVAWRLGESGSYTENWSREIDIDIPRETIDAYRRQDEKGRRIADENLVSLVRLKKREFHPEHDTPRYHVPPEEHWRVGPEDLAAR